eukprot:scaffold89826_cov19-Tisochrysis_lutea.AAC.1
MDVLFALSKVPPLLRGTCAAPVIWLDDNMLAASDFGTHLIAFHPHWHQNKHCKCPSCMQSAFGKRHTWTNRTQVQFTPDIALGVGCLVIYNIVVASVGLLNNSRIPEK